ncbi:MAG TPA: hypothetical protein EYG89_06215 [Bacteroidia bacterium]|nr:hypothetical protein [Bacteroidia bacterium]
MQKAMLVIVKQIDGFITNINKGSLSDTDVNNIFENKLELSSSEIESVKKSFIDFKKEYNLAVTTQ